MNPERPIPPRAPLLDRLIPREALPELARRLRLRGGKIVTTNGSFDLLHVGHIRYLAEAKAQGDILIVGLNSDVSVRTNKGPSRPINREVDRAEALLSLRSVDYVTVFDEPVPMPFIERVSPDVHVNGAEYGENCIEADTVATLGGRLHLVIRHPGMSTTAMVENILRAYKLNDTPGGPPPQVCGREAH